MRAELARRKLNEFVKQAWHVVEPGTEYSHNWHIDAICDHLEAVSRGHIRNLIINVPPRCMKSLLVSVFWPAWEWATVPERRWLFASYSQSLATEHSLACRAVVKSGWYQSNWPEVKIDSVQDEKTKFATTRRGVRFATSVGGSTTGHGGDRLVIDDPHNVLQSESESVREAAIKWWDTAMSTRGNDPNTVAKLVIMQRVHENDLTGHLLEQGGYEHLCLPMEYEPARSKVTVIGWSDPRNHDGDLLWPEHFTRESVDGLKRQMGSYAAAGQLQQRPAPAEGGLLKRNWWKFWTRTSIPAQFDTQLVSVDCSFKGTDDSDYVVMQCWAKSGADRYLLDQSRKKLDFPCTVKEFVRFCDKWPGAQTKIVEAKANGQAIIDTLRHQISGIVPEKPTESKEARVAAVSPEIESGNVYLPDPSETEWVEDFLVEADSFPNGAHDDQIDCMSQALKRLAKKKREFVPEIIRPY